MANHHFGKFADVWKHLVLTEVLAELKPSRYAETHAGSAAYAMTRDPERAYGALGFLDRVGSASVLAATPYAEVLRPFIESEQPVYPGSALQAMTMLGDHGEYLVCDVDPSSTRSLREWAERLGLTRCRVAQQDGISSVRDWVDCLGGLAVVHIDPFDPFAREDGGLSCVELAAEIAQSGHALVYWYGYSHPEERAWAIDAIRQGTDRALWCGDFMVTTRDGRVRSDGDLGEATTPGTGSGVVLANVSEQLRDRCQQVGHALAEQYDAVPLPDGELGRLDFDVLAKEHSG